MIDSLRGKIRDIDYLDERLQSRLATLRAAVEEGEASEIRKKMDEVERTAGKLRSGLRGFRLQEER